MGVVYRALQPSVNRHVAVKVLDRHLASDPEFEQRFRREVSILALLKHPAVLSIIDFGEADGYTYLVMPLVDGGTLADRLRGEPLPLAEVQRIISQVAEAIHYAHGKGVVHRDIKPSNILLDESGNCLVADFGIARVAGSGAHLTLTGTQVGTPAYMSPEQAEGEPGGPASDVYSLGIVLYELLTGRVPFKGDTPVAVAVKHVTAAVPPATVLNPAVDRAVEDVLLKALAKSPARRFSTARDLASALSATIGSTASATLERPSESDTDATLHRTPAATFRRGSPTADSTTETVRRTDDHTTVATGPDPLFASSIRHEPVSARSSGIVRAATLAVFAAAAGVSVYLMMRPTSPSESEAQPAPFESAQAIPATSAPRETLPSIPAPSESVSTQPLSAEAPPPPPPPPPPRVDQPADAPAPPPPGSPVRVSGNIKEPAKIRHVPPVYPPIAQSARVQGIVIIEAVIDPQGYVQETRVMRSIPLLDQAAIDAVKQWQFTPTLLNGVAVPVIMTVTVQFTLT